MEFSYEACFAEDPCIISVSGDNNVYVVRKDGEILMHLRKINEFWTVYGRAPAYITSDDIQAIGDEIENRMQ